MNSATESSRLLQGGICLVIALVVFAAILDIRHLGGLQATELRAYDTLLNLYAPRFDAHQSAVTTQPASTQDSSTQPSAQSQPASTQPGTTYPASAPEPATRPGPQTESEPPRKKSLLDPNVVILGITDDDIQEIGQYPPSDQTMAKALNKVCDAGASVVAVDIFRDLPVPDVKAAQEHLDPKIGSNELTAALQKHKNIIWVMELEKGTNPKINIQPPPFFRTKRKTKRNTSGINLVRTGYSDQSVDSDGVVRRATLTILDKENNTFCSLNFQAALTYLFQVNPDLVIDQPQIGHAVLEHFNANDGAYTNADTNGYQILIDFKGPIRQPHYSLSEILHDKVGREQLEGKVVMFGYTAHSSVKDVQSVPIKDPSRAVMTDDATGIFVMSDQQDAVKRIRWGVEIHGLIVDQIIRAAFRGDTPVHVWSKLLESLWLLAWCLLAAGIGFFFRGFWIFGVSVVFGATSIVAGGYFAFGHGWWIPIVPPLIGYLFSSGAVVAYLTYLERAERAVLMQLFSRHVSADIAKAIWDNRDQIMDTGGIQSRSMQATVLFTDAVGFSTTAEKMEAQEVFNWLNNYMEVMSGKVMEHKGIIDKYIGDSIMAVFGVPFPGEGRDDFSRDAKNAVRCALTMRKTLLVLNTEFTKRNQPNIGMRVGIHSGKVASGSLGSKHRLEFATIGDTVNTASRLESFDKELMDADIAANNCRILISQATLDLTDGEFKTRFIGNLHLKGKSELVNIYGVIGYADEKP